MARKSKKFIRNRKIALFSTVVLVIIVIGSLGYWHYHSKPSQVVINVPPAKSTTSTQNSSTDKSVPTATSNSDKSVASLPTSSDTQNPTDGTNNPPITPTGPFVSNHGQNSAYPAASEDSVCTTSPGASCYIEFTLGSTTLKLQPGIADSNGSVYWNNWDVNKQGFTSGQWTIKAVATINGQTTTATDGQDLVVQ